MKTRNLYPNIELLLIRSRNEITDQMADFIVNATGGPQNDETFSPSQIFDMVADAVE